MKKRIKKNKYRVLCEGEHCLLVDEDKGPIGGTNRFFSALESRGLSPRTIRAYAFDLLSFYRWMEQDGKSMKDINQSDLIEFVKEDDHETTLQYINLSMADITKEYESAVKQIERIYEDRQ